MKAVWKIALVCVGIVLALAFVAYIQYVESISSPLPNNSPMTENLYLKNVYVNGSNNAIFVDVTAVNMEQSYASQINSGIVKNDDGNTVVVDKNINITLLMGQSSTVKINYVGTLPSGQYWVTLTTEANSQFSCPYPLILS